jgi:hypothetical protein
MNAFILAAALHALTFADGELELMPVVAQDVALFRSNAVTAGGAGGGVGVQLTYRQLFLAQLDVGALWLLGNTVSTRVAVGVQKEGVWSPAAWLYLGALWGDRVEFLQGDGRRPSIPTWALGVRGSPLRFAGELGVLSALEPSIGVDFASGLWVELTILQIGVRL